MTDSTTLIPYESQLLSSAESVGVDIRPLIDLVPEAGDDAFVNIIRQIALAQSVEQLDAPWRSEGMKAYIDKQLTVRELCRMPSEYEQGLGLFLLVEAIDRETGEIVTLSTGSVAIVVQLLKANALDALPLTVIPRLAKRPSKNGYYPMHLEVVAS